jgi:hypothetical protein
MTPTNKLRWLNRPIPNVTSRVERVLQQWWEQKGMTMNLGWGGEMPVGEIKGEWRDVPLEVEV